MHFGVKINIKIDLTNDTAFDRYPRWSPDGKKILFVSDRSGTYEIWTINTDGTNLRQVTALQKDGISFPLWSPDGSRILFRQAPTLFVIDADKNWAQQKPETLPAFPDANRRFVAWDWSPDGKLLAGSFSGEPMDAGYFSFEKNGFELLTKMNNFPRWFSDNRRLLYGYENKLFITDIETKKVRELAIKPSGVLQTIGISRDNRLIYYTVASNESDIWLLDVSQNQ